MLIPALFFFLGTHDFLAGVKQISECFRERRFEPHDRAGNGMFELEAIAVQAKAMKRIFRRVVFIIADDLMTKVRHMAADLVFATGVDMDIQQ